MNKWNTSCAELSSQKLKWEELRSTLNEVQAEKGALEDKKLKEIESVRAEYENKLLEAKHASVENEGRLIRERDALCSNLKLN